LLGGFGSALGMAGSITGELLSGGTDLLGAFGF
jgi:hypothetical protein